ncbi:type II and III secretion system protein family protein [Zavarzinia sp. CC-PAN008]|uniref:type II and III secretion system protein family protein n=1 Tax=Zavarzinia sp. CC-PAN008 TaxID=3243332 RepID=UPI003F749537
MWSQAEGGRVRAKLGGVVASALAALCVIGVLVATAGAAQAASGRQVTMEVNSAQVVRVREPISEVFVSNPDIVDVQANSANVIYVYAKAPGKAVIYAATAENKVLVNLDVTVIHDISTLREVISSLDPGGNVTVTSLPQAIVLSGSVANATIAENVRAAAQGFLVNSTREQVINRLTVSSPTQVNIRVKVAEVSRSVTRSLGFNWESVFAIGGDNVLVGFANGRDFNNLEGRVGFERGEGGFFGKWDDGTNSVDGFIDALSREGLVSVLAQPNLTALSGETASFLSGGEFPIAASSNDGDIEIEFKQFGVSLAFTPTVLDNRRISMRIRPEVSSVTTNPEAGAVVLDNIVLPAISTRRAETTVELGSGQSIALAGLLQNNINTSIQKLPGLGDLPILGPLFRSREFQRNESELVILATPYLVNPVSGTMQTPTDGLQASSELDGIIAERLNRVTPQPGPQPAIGTGGTTLVGPSGFIVE